jgi:inorganic pyrophosphatase
VKSPISSAERAQVIRDLLGKQVHVEVDRPIGHRHKGMVYPVNYGFIPGLMAGDGEEQDAYILGVDTPLSEFTGKVIAVICRDNDIENKWVVAPESIKFSEDEIRELTFFQERYFQSHISLL